MNQKGWIPSNQEMSILALVFGIALVIALVYIATQPFSCPACNCPPPEKCPECNPVLSCPEPVCPSVCNLDSNSIKLLSDSFPQLNCLPNQFQQTTLFSLFLAGLSLLIAFINKKNELVGIIAGVGYLVVLGYMVYIGFVDYAMIGLIVFIAIIGASLFIRDEKK